MEEEEIFWISGFGFRAVKESPVTTNFRILCVWAHDPRKCWLEIKIMLITWEPNSFFLLLSIRTQMKVSRDRNVNKWNNRIHYLFLFSSCVVSCFERIIFFCFSRSVKPVKHTHIAQLSFSYRHRSTPCASVSIRSTSKTCLPPVEHSMSICKFM